jgi:hypothetical protein
MKETEGQRGRTGGKEGKSGCGGETREKEITGHEKSNYMVEEGKRR